MAPDIKDMPTITAYSRNDFREWLQKFHKKENRVTVIVHKKHTGHAAPTHRELIEEAICFGWIDTTIKRIDGDRFLRRFAKRTDKSRWSDNTLKYAKQLLKEGKMSPAGIHFYKLGLAKPTHDYGIPKNPDMPVELKSALAKNRKAKAIFAAFPPSTKRTLYRWILKGKLPETRNKRIKQVVNSALLGNKNVLRPSTKANL